jgi:hypothetical protein
MLKRTLPIVLALSLIALVPAQKGRVAPSDAQACATKVATEIKWHNSLDTALATARKENKLVFYMHMLGKIDGDT